MNDDEQEDLKKAMRESLLPQTDANYNAGEYIDNDSLSAPNIDFSMDNEFQKFN